jgi:hypothetical protein
MKKLTKTLRIVGFLVLSLAAVASPLLPDDETKKSVSPDSNVMPAWSERIFKFGGGFDKGLKGMPVGLSRQQAREHLRKAFEGTKGIGKTWKTAGKLTKAARVLKWLDKISDVKEVGYAAKEGGAEAASLRTLEVTGKNLFVSLVAEYGAAAGSAIGTLFPGPPHGTLIGGVVGGAAAAYAASYGYEKTVKTVFDDRIKKIIEEKRANQNRQVPKPPTRREIDPGQEPPPGIGPPTPPGKPPVGATIKCTKLIIAPPGEIEPGALARFHALADLELETTDTGLPSIRDTGVDVTGAAAWASSSGSKTAQGEIQTECSMEGQGLTATATFMNQTAAVTVKVKSIPLTFLKISAAPESAQPGKTVSLSAEATYKNSFCEFTKSNPPGLQYTVSDGATISGNSLTIDLDKESGYVTVSAILGPENIPSNTAVITVLPPLLERVVLSAPAAVNPCQIVTFELFGYYSHDPEVAVPLSTDSVLWEIAGRCAPLGPNVVRATWPGETIVVIAKTLDGHTDEARVKVNPLPNSSPWFPLQDVTISSDVKVGESITNTAIEFACEGSQHSAVPAKNVEWQSDAPEILSCTSNGICTGLAPGKANVRLIYNGREVTSRVVNVSESESEFEAEEEISGQEAEEAAKAPGKKGEDISKDLQDAAKKEKYRQVGENLGKNLGKALLQALAAKFDQSSGTEGTPPSSVLPPSPPKGGGATSTENDPFVGTWRITSWRIVQHSEQGAMEDADEINREAAQYYMSFSIRQPGNAYAVSGLKILIKEITHSGNTITIVGQDRSQNSVSDETITLILNGNQLRGTWRTVFEPDYFGRRQWQVAELTAVRL